MDRGDDRVGFELPRWHRGRHYPLSGWQCRSDHACHPALGHRLGVPTANSAFAGGAMAAANTSSREMTAEVASLTLALTAPPCANQDPVGRARPRRVVKPFETFPNFRDVLPERRRPRFPPVRRQGSTSENYRMYFSVSALLTGGFLGESQLGPTRAEITRSTRAPTRSRAW